jgi:hypothetical protein
MRKRRDEDEEGCEMISIAAKRVDAGERDD